MCPGKRAQIWIVGGCKNGGIGCDYVEWGRIAYASAELPRCAGGMVGGVRNWGGPRPPPRGNARVLFGKNVVEREKVRGAYCERVRCGRSRDMGVGRGLKGRRGDCIKLSGGVRWVDQGVGFGFGRSGPSVRGSVV